MNPIINGKPLSIYHIVKFPESFNSQPDLTKYPSILALHGHGGNEHNLIDLAAFLPENLLWISGRGPVESSLGSYDWYPVSQFGRPDPDLLEQSLSKIEIFIQELITAYPIDPQKVFLMGFSQGTMISLSYLLTHPQSIAGVIAQSGYVPIESGLHIDQDGVKGKPVLMIHGLEDSRMPLEWSQASRDFLLRHGVALDYQNFHMDHTITTDSLAAVKTWLEKQL